MKNSKVIKPKPLKVRETIRQFAEAFNAFEERRGLGKDNSLKSRSPFRKKHVDFK